MSTKPLRVGFDLDGVLLYNPARIARPIIATAKDFLLQSRKTSFYVPQKWWEKEIWRFLHRTSVFPAGGLSLIHELQANNVIEPYIVTARYGYLRGDFLSWVARLNRRKTFRAWYSNEQDEQPHLYKERMIRKLRIDIFVEDNWDIVSYLSSRSFDHVSQLHVFWIYNIFDRAIPYELKVSGLQQAVEKMRLMRDNGA